MLAGRQQAQLHASGIGKVCVGLIAFTVHPAEQVGPFQGGADANHHVVPIERLARDLDRHSPAGCRLFAGRGTDQPHDRGGRRMAAGFDMPQQTLLRRHRHAFIENQQHGVLPSEQKESLVAGTGGGNLAQAGTSQPGGNLRRFCRIRVQNDDRRFRIVHPRHAATRGKTMRVQRPPRKMVTWAAELAIIRPLPAARRAALARGRFWVAAA